MFFEPAAHRDLPDRPRSVPAPWLAPPPAEVGVLIPAESILARSTNTVIVLSHIRAFTTGCLLEVEVASRQGDLPAQEWHDRRAALTRVLNGPEAGTLPDWLLRLGLRLPDGTKTTTVDGAASGEQAPDTPLLTLYPVGTATRGGGEVAFTRFALWSRPLPPADVVELAVEWPLGGIPLTFASIDGRPIAAAGETSQHYWPV